MIKTDSFKHIYFCYFDIVEHSLKKYILPGHGSVLQSAACVESPEQYAPPLLGAGFVQLLVLDLDPVPQLKLHSL